MQLRFNKLLHGVQRQYTAQWQLRLGVRQPRLFQHQQHIAAGRRGKAAVGGFAVEVERVLELIAAFITAAGGAADAGAGAVAESAA